MYQYRTLENTSFEQLAEYFTGTYPQGDYRRICFDRIGIDEGTRNLYRKAMAAFGGIAPSYHIELLEKPTIYWDFHSLLLGIQMMFSFMLVDEARPLRLCKHCQKVFISSRANAAFCSVRCKNQYNVYKSRGKHKERDGDENA